MAIQMTDLPNVGAKVMLLIDGRFEVARCVASTIYEGDLMRVYILPNQKNALAIGTTPWQLIN